MTAPESVAPPPARRHTARENLALLLIALFAVSLAACGWTAGWTPPAVTAGLASTAAAALITSILLGFN